MRGRDPGGEWESGHRGEARQVLGQGPETAGWGAPKKRGPWGAASHPPGSSSSLRPGVVGQAPPGGQLLLTWDGPKGGERVRKKLWRLAAVGFLINEPSLLGGGESFLSLPRPFFRPRDLEFPG